MPRKAVSVDEELRHTHRGAAVVALAGDGARNFVTRILLRSPRDTVAVLIAFAATSAIFTNAVFMQTGPHPAPMFGSVIHIDAPASPANFSLLPRPRPVEADVTSSEPRLPEPRANEVRAPEPRTTDRRAFDPLGSLVRSSATGSLPALATAPPPASNVPRPPAPIPAVQAGGVRRVAAVQRVLTEFGYGQLRPTGTIGADTQAAIQKFERDRKLPVTGQMSDRLVRELGTMTGHPID